MSRNLATRIDRLEQRAESVERSVKYLWANSLAEVGEVADKYRAQHPGDQSQLVVFRWLDLAAATP